MIEPTPRARRPGTSADDAAGLVALLLRCTLGFGLLNAGLFNYQARRAGMADWVAVARNPYIRMTAFPGSGMFNDTLPLIQVVAGLALLIGFLTAYAAGIAGLILVFDSLVQSVTLVLSGVPRNVQLLNTLAANNMLFSGLATGVLLASAVLWLSAAGADRWSVDRLVFGLPGLKNS